MNAQVIYHTPQWQQAELPIDAAGNTRPGYVCVHQLENGNGPCGGTVFDLGDAFGLHSCATHGPGQTSAVTPLLTPGETPMSTHAADRDTGYPVDPRTGVIDTDYLGRGRFVPR